MKLGALPYHADVAAHLRGGEAELWAWFESDQFSKHYTESVKLELLKSTYRLTRADQPGIYAQADHAVEKLGLGLPVTIYQRHGGADDANAALIFLPGEVAIVMMGNIGELLGEDEMLAMLGHEISHHRLYSLDGGRYFTAARFLEWAAGQPGCEASIVETERLYRLHTEIFADMGALHVSGSRDAVIATLIKVATGLKSVSPGAYLEQADEILEKHRQGSEALTHPELYIRAKALDLLAVAGAPSLPEVAALVRGPLEATRLDLIGQRTLSALTRRLIDLVLAPPPMRGEFALNLAERYFQGYEPLEPSAATHAGLADDIAAVGASCHNMLAYVLLDFATVDPDGGDVALAWSLDVAEQTGLFAVYEPIARKELNKKKNDLAKLKRSPAGRTGKAPAHA